MSIGKHGIAVAFVALACGCTAPAAPEPERASLVESLRNAIGPLIEAESEGGRSLLMSVDTLYAPLDVEQRAFLNSIQALADAPIPDLPSDDTEWARLEDQIVHGPQGETQLPVQLLPMPVWEAYEAMSAAMEQDLGKRLRVFSGFRSHAYQLFVFVSYLPVANYSFEETLRHVSMPSEHSQPQRQGIDFVNEEGIDLQSSDPERFMNLPEYAWLIRNAARFGFSQSPGESAKTSPWHWHWDSQLEVAATRR